MGLGAKATTGIGTGYQEIGEALAFPVRSDHMVDP